VARARRRSKLLSLVRTLSCVLLTISRHSRFHPDSFSGHHRKCSLFVLMPGPSDNGKTERIRDPIHDMIVFRAEEPIDMTAWRLLETSDVQRLRRIKQLGVSEFVYHHYGPYSDMLAERVEDDAIFGHLRTSTGRRVSDGVPYVIYRADRPGDGDRIDQHLSVDRIRSAIAEMQRSSATVLELAATIHWLAFVEGLRNWRDELVQRKGAKTQGGRDGQALELLGRLGLSPIA
jgi:uncharacterized protein YwgA